MPIKSYRPTTPTRRFQTVVSREEITKQKPEKSLVAGKKRTGGRNSRGEITVLVPRRRAQEEPIASSISSATRAGVPAKVAAIEYDPNRSARHRPAALRATARSATSCTRWGWRWGGR